MENPADTEEQFKHVRDTFDLLVAKGVQVPRHESMTRTPLVRLLDCCW
jgi:hypothetical protein